MRAETDQHSRGTVRTVALAGVMAVGLIAAGCATHPPPAATPRAPAPSATSFVATAYCHSATTAAGVKARPGIVAADPAVLPLGSVIRVERTGGYDGTYTVMDTGSKLQGRRVDLFIDSCAAAKRFGRRTVLVHVVDAARR